MSIEININFRPISVQSGARFGIRGAYSDTRKRNYLENLAGAARLHMLETLSPETINSLPITKPCMVSLTFRFPVPRGKRSKIRPGDPHTVKPDLDNLIKPVLDALQPGPMFKAQGMEILGAGVIADDKTIYRFPLVEKVYSSDPGISITIIPVETISRSPTLP